MLSPLAQPLAAVKAVVVLLGKAFGRLAAPSGEGLLVAGGLLARCLVADRDPHRLAEGADKQYALADGAQYADLAAP
jgi:hypothetical protein